MRSLRYHLLIRAANWVVPGISGSLHYVLNQTNGQQDQSQGSQGRSVVLNCANVPALLPNETTQASFVVPELTGPQLWQNLNFQAHPALIAGAGSLSLPQNPTTLSSMVAPVTRPLRVYIIFQQNWTNSS